MEHDCIGDDLEFRCGDDRGSVVRETQALDREKIELESDSVLRAAIKLLFRQHEGGAEL
jgi:hypothetical protein